MRDPEVGDRIKELISMFRSNDGAQRQRARQQLVERGKSIIPYLNEFLSDNNNQVRWEIAKTLEELKSPSAAPAMVRLLTDDVPGIRWLAGEGLINLKEKAIVPLLKGLQVDFQSIFFREGAHHILRELERNGLLNDKMVKTLEALEGIAPAVTVPFAAAEALGSLEGSPTDD
jgi:HEAT repeat protein